MRGGHAQYPGFTPKSSEVAAGLLVFLYLVQNLPQPGMQRVIFVPHSFFAFCCSRCLARYRPCSKGSQVPACLTWALLFRSCVTLGNPHPLSEPPFSLSRTGKKSAANQAPCIQLSGDTSSCCPGGGVSLGGNSPSSAPQRLSRWRTLGAHTLGAGLGGRAAMGKR